MSAVGEVLDRLSPVARVVLAQRLAAARRQRDAARRFEMAFPETGPLRRELYHKAVEFFAAGATHLERCLCGGNRVGKTSTAAYELTAHLTGRYPAWWVGRRFDRPVVVWAAGDDAKSVREAAQAVLLGEPGAHGQGMIPGDAIMSMTRKSGVPDAIDSALIRHVSGGKSRLVMKAYDQRRESFQGARVDVGWCDEEPPGGVYSEFLTRLMSTVPGEPNGVMLPTFTPLRGLSDVVLRFLPGGKPSPDNPRYVTFVGWADVPHLSAEEKAKLEEAYMPHEREARMKGIPSIGAGAIYPVPESDFVCKPFELPAWYRRWRRAVATSTTANAF